MAKVASQRARALIRGGNANNGSNAGIGYVNVNNAVGNANTNIGGRLSTSTQKSLHQRHKLITGHKVNYAFSEV